MALPTWMRERARPDSPLAPTAPPRRNFTRLALAQLARVLAELLTVEISATHPGLLQRLDPRAKVVGVLGILVVCTLVQGIGTVGVALLFCLGLAALGRIPLRRLALVWLTVPLITVAIMAPATLNVITPGAPVLTLCRLPWEHLGAWPLPDTLAITADGLAILLRMVLRAGVCVTLVLLLTATTRTARLFFGLRGLGVPNLFVMLLAMMERYLTMLLRAAEEIHLAKLSRTVRPGTTRAERAWVATGMGALLRRTHTLSQAIYLAMLARGYTGEVYLLDPPRWRAAEWLFLLGTAGLGALLILLG
jgi:cobalt/nickel transport system permease protein